MEFDISKWSTEISIIEEIISEIKKEKNLSFIQNKIQIKYFKPINMWINPKTKMVIVSSGLLEELRVGNIDRDEIRVMLVHEFGHLSEKPSVPKILKWIIPSILVILLFFLIFKYFNLMNFFFTGVYFVIFITFYCSWTFYWREWERIAERYTLSYTKNTEKIKILLNKINSQEALLSRIFEKKPFYYFSFRLTFKERMKLIEEHEKKLK